MDSCYTIIVEATFAAEGMNNKNSIFLAGPKGQLYTSTFPSLCPSIPPSVPPADICYLVFKA